MRKFVLTALMLAGTSPAFASSIEVIGPQAAKLVSIVTISCAHCPPPLPKEDKDAYKVPAVPSGQQTAEIIEVDGQKKLKRVESWLGGSPVTIISSADGWSTNGSVIIAGNTPDESTVDHDATTAAVTVTPPADGKPDLNTADFDLRMK